MDLIINGQPRVFAELSTGATLSDLLSTLNLKADRVAVEQNGSIVPRTSWPTAVIASGDRFEIVHFVGGGSHPSPVTCNPSPVTRHPSPVTRHL